MYQLLLIILVEALMSYLEQSTILTKLLQVLTLYHACYIILLSGLHAHINNFCSGMTGQSLISPPVTTPPQQLAHPGSSPAIGRLPIGVEQLPSPSHPNTGIALVRPVPQQASPVRVSTCTCQKLACLATRPRILAYNKLMRIVEHCLASIQ